MTASTRRRTTRWIVALAAASSLFGLAPAASAAPRPGGADFQCRASALRVALVGQTLLEPTIANAPDAPCADGTAAIIAPTDIGPVRVNAVNADTRLDPDNLAVAPGISAQASATTTNPVIDVSGIRITASVIGSAASYACTNGQPTGTGSSVVADLAVTINGAPFTITLPENNAPLEVDLLGIASLRLNQRTDANGRITFRALELRVPSADASVANVVIGESTVGLTGNPCAANPPQCSDTLDNDGDGRSDAQDPGCLSGPGGAFNPADDDETNAATQCNDGVDNDGDGRIDFPSDRGCRSLTDTSERTPSGTSRLGSNPSRIARAGVSGSCVRSAFSAVVTGRSIASVVFSVDGRRVRTDRSSPFSARIRTTRAGTHRVTARVTFLADSRTSARTLRFGYRRCAAGAPRVRFTG